MLCYASSSSSDVHRRSPKFGSTGLRFCRKKGGVVNIVATSRAETFRLPNPQFLFPLEGTEEILVIPSRVLRETTGTG